MDKDGKYAKEEALRIANKELQDKEISNLFANRRIVLQEKVKGLENQVADWKSRVYRDNKQSVTIGSRQGDGDGEIAINIGDFNAMRRAKKIKGFQEEIFEMNQSFGMLDSLEKEILESHHVIDEKSLKEAFAKSSTMYYLLRRRYWQRQMIKQNG